MPCLSGGSMFRLMANRFEYPPTQVLLPRLKSIELAGVAGAATTFAWGLKHLERGC
jgi:hypothetical protein